MSGQHTPGPWAIVEDRSPSSLEVFGGGAAIAELWRRADVVKEKADARLIAAAPDLLEALQMGVSETLDYIQRNHLSGAENNHWIAQAKAAIAKATGVEHA